MASEKVTALLEEIKAMTVLELSELVHAVEEEFGVSAAAAVAVAAPADGGAAAAEEKTEFDVVLAEVGSEKRLSVKSPVLVSAKQRLSLTALPKPSKRLCPKRKQKLQKQSSKKSAQKSNSNKLVTQKLAPCRLAAGCFFADCFRCYRKAPYYVIRTRKNPVLLFRKEPQYGVLNYIIQSYCRLFHGADFDNRTVRICRYRKGCRTADIQQYHLFRVGNRNLVKCVCFL